MRVDGRPRTVLVFGGNSDIALAIVDRLEDEVDELRVVLAVRNTDTCVGAGKRSVVGVEAYDATDVAAATAVIERAVAHVGDIDLVLIAAGVLGDQDALDGDPVLAGEVAVVNYVGAVVAGTAAARQLATQGGGQICVLSSIAGVRVRTSMPVYGSAKAGMDAFFTAGARRWAPEGVSVLIVRPGFVATKMTEGLEPAPFSTTPERVARSVVSALRTLPPGTLQVCWAPRVLRIVAAVLRRLPVKVLARLDA